MKKLIAMLLALTMMAVMFVGCSEETVETKLEDTPDEDIESENTPVLKNVYEVIYEGKLNYAISTVDRATLYCRDSKKIQR